MTSSSDEPFFQLVGLLFVEVEELLELLELFELDEPDELEVLEGVVLE